METLRANPPESDGSRSGCDSNEGRREPLPPLPDTLFRAMVEGHDAVMLLVDPTDGRILWANDAAARYYGYPRRALQNMSMICLGDREPAAAAHERGERGGLPCASFESSHRMASGEVRPVEMACTRIDFEGHPLLFTVVRDIAARRQVQSRLLAYQRQLEVQNEELRRLTVAIEQSGSTIVITDPEGTILYANPRFEETTGYTVEEARGQNPRILKSGELDEAAYRALWETISGGRVWRGEFHNRRKDGSLYWEAATIAPVVDERGRITNYIAIKEDITARKEAQESSSRYARQLEAQNAELDAFAHTVAHDLKGPLGALVGFSELLIDAPTMPEGERIDLLARVHEIGWQMTRILDALLLLSATRRKKVDIEPLDMGGIVARVVERLGPMVSEHGAQITTLAPEEWPTALGYAPWVEEVWMNYLSNALKYGGRPPRVELGASATADGHVRFWVQDNATGLSAEEQAKLFAPFTRLRQVSVEGHGLGLSIVRRIVERLGGEAGVAGERGRGSTFFFTLPQASQTVEGLPPRRDLPEGVG